MLLQSLPVVLLIVRTCCAISLSPVSGTNDSVCHNATGPAHDPTCWAALGYNAWFDAWKGPCHEALGCGCERDQPWSDCALKQYQSATGTQIKMTVSCINLKQPELCQIPASDWTELTENQLGFAYASIAIGNLYHFVHEWFTVIENGTAQAAILSVLSDQISNPSRGDINATTINTTILLGSLMTIHGTNSSVVQSFISVVSRAVSVEAIFNLAKMDIIALQNTLCQALAKALDATLSNWSTPYFDDLSKNGALLRNPIENRPQLNESLDRIPPPDPFNTTLHPSLLSINNNINANISTTRTLLSTDVLQAQNFFIHECNADSPGDLASQLSHLLTTFHNNLHNVMKETSRGPRSNLGFAQIFKTEKWIPIRRLYEHMYRGIGTRGNLAASHAIPDNPPLFICLQPHNPSTHSAYAACVAEPRLRAFQQPGQPYAIGLCPAFWALPAGPVRAFCPSGGGEVREEFIGNALLLNQQSFIVYQLVRIYLGADILDPERFTLGEVLGLSSEEAYRNPSTWAYWFASVIGCTPQSWEGSGL